MNEQLSIEQIASRIHFIRSVKVMLDSDLAELCGVDTKQLKRSVRRNIERFPSDFMFELAKNEYESLRCQNGSLKRGSHSKYLPFAFTEQGVAMLSGILSNKRAIYVNIQIMRTFTQLRHMLLENADLRKAFDELKQVTEDRFQIIFETLDQLLTVENKPKKRIGFMVKEEIHVYSGVLKIGYWVLGSDQVK